MYSPISEQMIFLMTSNSKRKLIHLLAISLPNLSEMKNVLSHTNQNKLKDRMIVLQMKRSKKFNFSLMLRSKMKDMRIYITFLIFLLLLSKM
jgi:hypothetical protein